MWPSQASTQDPKSWIQCFSGPSEGKMLNESVCIIPHIIQWYQCTLNMHLSCISTASFVKKKSFSGGANYEAKVDHPCKKKELSNGYI